jgi:hypothetical protein
VLLLRTPGPGDVLAAALLMLLRALVLVAWAWAFAGALAARLAGWALGVTGGIVAGAFWVLDAVRVARGGSRFGGLEEMVRMGDGGMVPQIRGLGLPVEMPVELPVEMPLVGGLSPSLLGLPPVELPSPFTKIRVGI